MRKEIRRVDLERGILQCTTVGERWYYRPVKDPVTGLESSFEFRPSVTFIVGHYPKGPQFETWLKKNGEESDRIKAIAGEHGYKEHGAIAKLNAGEPVNIDQEFLNPTTGKFEQLDTEEWSGVCSYVDWWHTEGKQKYRILDCEFVTWPDAAKLATETGLAEACFKFAGTVDIKAERIEDGKIGIIDIKRSKDIYPSHEMQVNAYRMSEGAEWQAILQINYKRTKTRKWKFTDIEDKFTLFRATMAIWQEETNNAGPLQRDFPLVLSLDVDNAAMAAGAM